MARQEALPCEGGLSSLAAVVGELATERAGGLEGWRIVQSR
jgi:hypothetical protein